MKTRMQLAEKACRKSPFSKTFSVLIEENINHKENYMSEKKINDFAVKAELLQI